MVVTFLRALAAGIALIFLSGLFWVLSLLPGSDDDWPPGAVTA